MDALYGFPALARAWLHYVIPLLADIGVRQNVPFMDGDLEPMRRRFHWCPMGARGRLVWGWRLGTYDQPSLIFVGLERDDCDIVPEVRFDSHEWIYFISELPVTEQVAGCAALKVPQDFLAFLETLCASGSKISPSEAGRYVRAFFDHIQPRPVAIRRP